MCHFGRIAERIVMSEQWISFRKEAYRSMNDLGWFHNNRFRGRHKVAGTASIKAILHLFLSNLAT